MKTQLLRGRFILATWLSIAALPAAAAPVQYSLDFNFSGFSSMGGGLAVPYDPVQVQV